MKSTASGRFCDVAHVGRGFLMGGADIIPGVSGGTVALILGIYERLVTAISRFDLTLLGHLRKGRWSAAANHVDLRFLVALGLGILLGIGGLASLLHWLLEDHYQPTMAAFFGLILASSFLVGRMTEGADLTDWLRLALLGAIAAGSAYWLMGQPFLQERAGPDYLYLFCCAVVAICAMILPGISGAFILLVLGKYAYITGVIKDIVHLHITAENLLTVLVFASGCAVGLITFSKLLRWLLAHYRSMTMAILCGLMVGSLRKVWPFKSDTTPNLPFKEKVFVNQWPASMENTEWLCLGVVLVAACLVLLVDFRARKRAPDVGE